MRGLDVLVIDLQRVSGVDASAAAALTKAERLAAAHGTEIVLTGASEIDGIAVVPEPGIGALLVMGLGAFYAGRKR